MNYLSGPYVNTLVEASGSQVFAIRRKGHAVHGLCVLGECMDTQAAFNIPQSDGGIERSAGKNQIHVWIIGARASRTPLNGVDFFAVSLQIVDTSVLFH